MSPDELMGAALAEAQRAFDAGEVPIGAIAAVDGEIVARAFNQPISACDPTAHAEVVVIREAARALGNYRLTGLSVYVTVEPCLMCVGALIHARVREVVYGVPEPKTGALHSVVRALDTPGLNHRFTVTPGVREGECRDVLQRFFQARRRGVREVKL